MELYFKETGKNNDETIVFIHGGGLSGWMWNKQVEAFNDYHCIVPDLPEHGKSAEVKPFTIKGAAEMIVDIIKNHAHNRKAHLVGLSLGSQVAVQILSIAPEVVNRALISGTLVREYYGPTTLKLINLWFRIYTPFKNTDFSIKYAMKGNGASAEYFEYFKENMNILTLSCLKNIYRENALFRISGELCQVNNSILIIAAEREMKYLSESAKDLNKCLPNSQMYMVPNVKHNWALDAPELFSSVSRAWIKNKQILDSLSKF